MIQIRPVSDLSVSDKEWLWCYGCFKFGRICKSDRQHRNET